MNKKQAIQFEEGDCLVETEGLRLEVKDGEWQWYRYETQEYEWVGILTEAILDRLTEIVKPLRTHKIGEYAYREDGYYKTRDIATWRPIQPNECEQDLFTSWGWPIPAHMEGK